MTVLSDCRNIWRNELWQQRSRDISFQRPMVNIDHRWFVDWHNIISITTWSYPHTTWFLYINLHVNSDHFFFTGSQKIPKFWNRLLKNVIFVNNNKFPINKCLCLYLSVTVCDGFMSILCVIKTCDCLLAWLIDW